MRTLCNKKGCLAKNEYDKPHPLVAATCNSGNLSVRQQPSGGRTQQLLNGMHINKDQRHPGSQTLPIRHFQPHRMTTVQIKLQLEKAARDPSKSKARSFREKKGQSIRAPNKQDACGYMNIPAQCHTAQDQNASELVFCIQDRTRKLLARPPVIEAIIVIRS